MARNKMNLNRFRKIYPRLRKSPFWWYREQGGMTIETHQAAATAGQLSYQTLEVYNSPVVVATAEDNVNVWVASITPVGDGTFAIAVQCSDTSYTGDIHLHIGEGNG